MNEINRCGWALTEPNITYHDTEWGVPLHDDNLLFEKLILDGMQAGLSWETILKKKDNFRKAFYNFNVDKILTYDQEKIDSLMQDTGIIRNRLKIQSVITNARAFREVQSKYGSFDVFLWSYVDGKPIINSWETLTDVPTSTPLSDKISKDMKKLGFKFVGTTIIYAYIQAVGLVNDHTKNCFLYKGQ